MIECNKEGVHFMFSSLSFENQTCKSKSRWLGPVCIQGDIFCSFIFSRSTHVVSDITEHAIFRNTANSYWS